MAENLEELLEGDNPVDLKSIERALSSEHSSNESVETVLSALIWERCTSGPHGVLGAFVNPDCAARIGFLDTHLERIGAPAAARAVRELRRELQVGDEPTAYSLIDRVDANPDAFQLAENLNEQVEDVAPLVWRFMQDHQDELPKLEIEGRIKGFFGQLFGRE